MVSPSPSSTSSGARRPAHRTRAVAVDIGSAAVHAVELELAGGPETARILKRGSASFSQAVWDDPTAGKEQLAQAIRQALQSAGITATQATAALPRRLVTVKYASLPYAEPDQLRQIVQYEAQQYIPFPIDEVVVDHQVVSEAGEEMATVMIVAARRTLVDEVLAAFDKAGIEVTQLSVSSLALAEHARSATLPQALLEVEPAEVDMAVVAGGRLLFTRAASLIESADTPGGVQLLASEVVRSLSAYQNENRGQPVSKVLVASPGPQTPAIEDALGGVIDAPISRMNGQLLPAGDPDAARYATAMGLALQADGAGLSTISLIPAARTERKLAARRNRQAGVALVFLLLLLAFAGYETMQWLARQRDDRVHAAAENAHLNVAKNKLKQVTAQHDAVSKQYGTVSLGLMRPAAAVDLLKAVSDALPKSGGVYLSELTYDRLGALNIRGNADDQSGAIAFAQALQKSGTFSTVQLVDLGDVQTQVAAAATAPGAAAGSAPKMKQATSFIMTAVVRGSEELKPGKNLGRGLSGGSDTSGSALGGA